MRKTRFGRKKLPPAPPTPQIEYTAATGTRFTNEDAQKLGPYLTELAKKHGRLTRKLLLEIAEDTPKSPLRGYFDWNDTSAARRYRLIQAGEIIRFVKYYAIVGETRIETRAFENVRVSDQVPNATPGRGYVLASTVFTNDDLSRQILERALKELRSWEDRYKTKHELATRFKPIFEAIANWEEELFGPKQAG
jgi:hypothetical protein